MSVHVGVHFQYMLCMSERVFVCVLRAGLAGGLGEGQSACVCVYVCDLGRSRWLDGIKPAHTVTLIIRGGGKWGGLGGEEKIECERGTRAR